jgi:hypothetical protein
VPYLISAAISLAAGGVATLVAFREVQDPTLPMIIAIVLIVAFLAACAWRISHPENRRNARRN